MRKNYISIIIALAIGIGLFFVIFLWNFWNNGLNAIGLNFMVFGFLIIFFYILASRLTKKLSKKSIAWIIPMTMIIFSLGIYSTSFTGTISLIFLPIIFFIFTSHESHKNLRQIIWSKLAPFTLGKLFLSFVSSIFKSSSLLQLKNNSVKEKKYNITIIGQVVLGLFLLFIVSITVIIPLLSSADATFANIFKDFIVKIKDFFISLKSLPLRLSIMALVTLILLGFAHYWNRIIDSVPKKPLSTKKDNSIVAGIVLFGILILYLLFIAIQIHTLFINKLPVNFSETEALVKSGFWQLFLLTLINILFYVSIFRKTNTIVQRILTVFTVASLLLISSATYRVFLYVTIYGLSYEKFFAFYTVIFCSIVFVWFLFLFTYPQDKPVWIIKTLAFLALWMYAFTTIIPLDRFIFNTNLKLTQQENSRININELRMLSFDALPLVEKNFDILIREARKDYLATKDLDSMPILKRENYTENAKNKDLNKYVNDSWQRWIERHRENKGILKTRYFSDCEQATSEKYTACQCSKPDNYRGVSCRAIKYKKWYEHTLKELFYKPTEIDFESKKFPIDNSGLQTFKSSINNINLTYSKDLKVYYPDYYSEYELRNKEWKITFADKNNNNLFIVFNKKELINGNDEIELNKTENYLQQVRNNPQTVYAKVINLKNLSGVKAYGYGATWEKSKQHDLRLIIDAPDAPIIIYSNTKHDGIADRHSLNDAQYIAKITPSKDLQNIIKSIKITSLHKLNDENIL